MNYKKPFQVKPGKYVRISVRDTGMGIDKAIQQKIFEPFFTTKAIGRGTGLGLASVYGIVKNHGGHITVYSELGHGAIFNLYLPASDKEVLLEKRVSAGIQRGAETVLLIDDEEIIVDVVGKALNLSGYKVLVARNGEEGLNIFQNSQGQISVVLLDMVMPGMSGEKVFGQLKTIDPDVKVILSSGYSLDEETSGILARGCKAFIQKPFGILDLSQKIREVLDENNQMRSVLAGNHKPVIPFDDLVKSRQNDGFVKISRCKARKSEGVGGDIANRPTGAPQRRS